jgi:acetylornithine deacetylase/succinyl-diaminopimelate desuccinylase-like protein
LVRQQYISSQEQGVAKIVETKLRAMDFDDVYIDENVSLVGIRAGNRPGTRVTYDAHMDMVPANDLTEWTVDPYGGELRDRKIWGRGSTDINGGLANMLIA